MMAPQPRSDYNDLSALLQSIQTTLNPLTNKLQVLEDKVDKLSQDRATRSDIDKLRDELKVIYVTRDSYEPRHASLIERNAQLENMIRDLRKDTEQDQQKIEEMIKQQQEKPWTRIGQLAGYAGFAVAALDWLFQHVRF